MFFFCICISVEYESGSEKNIYSMGMTKGGKVNAGKREAQMSEHRAEPTCEQRFGAAGSGAAGFSGALNDPAISLALNTLPCNLH